MPFHLTDLDLSGFLFIIPARGGSKSILKKNLKPLCGKPLIYYTINFARQFVPDSQICLSTDDPQIIELAVSMGLNVPFIRPDEISGDHTGMMEVLKHAWSYYENMKIYNGIILLQPTSPFRRDIDLIEAVRKFRNTKAELLFSAFKVKENPYFLMYRETDSGNVENLFHSAGIERRQDAPEVLQANGAFYILDSLCLTNYSSFRDVKERRVQKMPYVNSLDIDDIYDWYMAELYISNQLVELDNFEYVKSISEGSIS